MPSRLGLCTFVACICAVMGFAQTNTTEVRVVAGPAPMAQGTMGGVVGPAPIAPGMLGGVATYTAFVSPNSGPAVIDGPYSAEYVSQNVRLLPDGTRITNTQPSEKIWRDAQGRTRRERIAMSGPSGFVSPTIAEIRDPVAGFAYVLDPDNKVAHRVKLQANPNPNMPAARSVTALTARPANAVYQVSSNIVMSDGTVRKTEHLGVSTIEGVQVEGTRNITVYPAGNQGADREITVVSENWTSPYFDRSVLNQMNDPRSGNSVSKLINISVTNPDPSLFMPPAGWTVVDEEGPQIKIPIMRRETPK